MKITVEKLKRIGACSEGVAWVEGQKDKSLVALVDAAIANPVYKEDDEDGEEYDTLDFCNWGITRLMTEQQAVLYACFAARQVLKIYEDKYPGDDRPRKAIEAAEAYTKDPSEENRQAAAAEAEAAAEAAAWAAWAARAAAAWAARATAWAAAARAAEAAAAWAAEAAAWAAAAEENKNRMKAEILRYGVKLMMGGK